jgi:hypothetical protein
VVWAPDGTHFLAGGTVQMQFAGVSHDFVRAFLPDGHKAGPDIPVSESTIMSLVPCGDKIAFSAADPSFGLLSTIGEAITLQKGHAFDARNKLRDAFTISPNAMRIRFGLGYGAKTPVLFDLAAGALTDAASPIAGLTSPSIDGLDIKNWEDTYKPLFKGKPIALKQYEMSRSLAIRDDRAGFALGSEWHVRAFAVDGAQLWEKSAPGIAFGINLTRDGNIVAAAYGDGTLRWHRGSDGQELLALFVDRETRRWVAWTPSGYYMASPGGEDLIGWHVNRGWDQQADFFPASRFRDRFHRPDIVQSVLDTLDEAAAVRNANDAAHRREEPKPIAAALPPVVKILSPEQGAAFSGYNITLDYSLRAPSGLPVDKVEILIDGSPTGASAPGLVASAAGEATRQSVKIGLPPQDVEVGLVAKSGALVSEVAHIKLVYRGAPPAEQEVEIQKPMLYALLVGVADYQDPKLQLGYSAKDAQDLAEALKTQAGGLYRDVKVRVMTDKDATAVGVKDGLLWLQKETTSRDLAVVFLAGHGVTDARNEFWFLPYDADSTRLFSTAVSRYDIIRILHDLPGKKILFLDACHSGAVLPSGMQARGAPVDVNAAINDFATAESGLVAYAASTGREFSVESDQWQHGAFTKALIEAIEGKGDILHKGRITTASLDAYLAERVKELTGGEQHPVMSRPDAVPDFPIALVR